MRKPTKRELLVESLRRGMDKDVFQWTVADVLVEKTDPWDRYWCAETLIQSLPDQMVEMLRNQLNLYAAGASWPLGLLPPSAPEEKAWEAAKGA
jgi:hypothetical protein